MTVDPMMPSAYVVTTKRQELGDTWTLELEPAEWRAWVNSPGQFAMLYAFGSGEVPISVSAADGGSLVHTVRAVGAATRAICSCEPGRPARRARAVRQQLAARGGRGRDVVVVTGGIGLAPLRPAIEQLIASREARRGRVLYGPARPRRCSVGELQAWREAGIDVKYTVDSAAGKWDGRVGLVTKLIPSPVSRARGRQR